jgi:hypothetical protein
LMIQWEENEKRGNINGRQSKWNQSEMLRGREITEQLNIYLMFLYFSLIIFHHHNYYHITFLLHQPLN